MGYPASVDNGLVVPQALYDGELSNNAANVLAAGLVVFVSVTALAPMTLTAVRCRFSTGGNGHFDTGIYDASGTNGQPGNLLAHGASSATALASATGLQTPAFLGGNLPIAPGKYWLALWIDNATDSLNKSGTGSANMVVVMSGTYSAGPLPQAASLVTGLANYNIKPELIGLIAGSWS